VEKGDAKGHLSPVIQCYMANKRLLMCCYVCLELKLHTLLEFAKQCRLSIGRTSMYSELGGAGAGHISDLSGLQLVVKVAAPIRIDRIGRSACAVGVVTGG
jgi:hypothetical protein